MKRYLAYLFGATLAIMLLIGGFNWLVDPYRIFGGPVIDGFNALKPAIAKNQRIFETVSVARKPPQAIILGTSRADVGLDPEHPALSRWNTFNLATSGQPIYETMRLFKHALDGGRLEVAAIGLDFSSSNIFQSVPADFDESNFRSGRAIKLLFSFPALRDSLETINQQDRKAILTERGLFQSNGFRMSSFEHIMNKGGHHRAFIESETTYLNFAYLPPPRYAYEFADTVSGRSTLNYLREMLALAYQRGVDTYLLISPCHARQLEIIDTLSLFGKFEEWKRRLVRINEEEARKVHKPPFPLWDFSGYNSITTEAVPPPGDASTRMRWYWESSHYTKEAGDLMLNRIFGYQAPNATLPEDFGVRLTTANIEGHLARIRADRQRYRQTNREDVAEIRSLATRVLPPRSGRLASVRGDGS